MDAVSKIDESMMFVDVDDEAEETVVDVDTDDGSPLEGGYGPMYEGGWIHSGPGGTVGGDDQGNLYFSDGETSYYYGD